MKVLGIFTEDNADSIVNDQGGFRGEMGDGRGDGITSDGIGDGSGPTVSVSVNPANNRINSTGYAHDANGNLTAMPNGGRRKSLF